MQRFGPYVHSHRAGADARDTQRAFTLFRHCSLALWHRPRQNTYLARHSVCWSFHQVVVACAGTAFALCTTVGGGFTCASSFVKIKQFVLSGRKDGRPTAACPPHVGIGRCVQCPGSLGPWRCRDQFSFRFFSFCIVIAIGHG